MSQKLTMGTYIVMLFVPHHISSLQYFFENYPKVIRRELFGY
jgi:hypothetical protein